MDRAILEQKALEQAQKEVADELHFCETRYLWANGKAIPPESLEKLKNYYNADIPNRVKHLVSMWAKQESII